MAQATISTKYQVVIPLEVRKALKLAPGQTVQVLNKGGVIYLIPVRPTGELRGLAKGAKLSDFREKEDLL
ncbi:MAG: AbrB/MazE/SpoVT family DNA-binding domain-containing protein [Myxococcota bacterium]